MNKTNFSSASKLYIDYFIIFIILITGMWQLFFSTSIMKWDMADINLPWNFFITECINQGILPLWNPYSKFGFPQYGDPGTWYPIKYLIGFIRQYDIYAMHFEYLLHLFLAGVGMYKLSSYHGFSRPVRLISSVAYMFSGFFIGNAQHIWWLINAAWLPFGLLYFLRLHKNHSFADVIKLGFVFFLMLSGGYPGLFISTVYLFIIIFLIFSFSAIKNGQYREFSRFLSKLSVSVIIFIASALVVLVSSFDFSHFINRGTALPYEGGGILFGSYSPRALLSVLFSYASGYNKTEFWGPDFSMVNTYFGFFSLIFLLFAFLQGKFSRQSLVYTGTAILFLMIAMAEVFPFRKWLYLYVPFMNMFRFSSLFRIFAILFLILASGYVIEKLITDINFRKKSIKYLIYTSALLFVCLIFLFLKSEKWMFKFLVTDGFTFFNSIAGISERIFLQGMIILFFSILLIFIAIKVKSWWKYALVFVIFTDMVIAVQLNIKATVVSDYNPRVIQSYLKKSPVGFPVPTLNHAVKTMNDSAMGNLIPYLWRNLGELHKIPSTSSFSPYKLTNTQNAIKDHQIDDIIELPPVFLTKSPDSKGWTDAAKNLQTYSQSIKITRFEPGTFEFDTNTDTLMYLVIQQNMYPYWKAKTDRIPQTIIPAAGAFMAIRLGEGYHHTTLTFENNKVKNAFWASLVTWILCIFLLIFWYIKKPAARKEQTLRFTLVFVVIVFILLLFVNNKKRYRYVDKTYSYLYQYINKLSTDTVDIILNIGNQASLPESITDNSSLVRLQQLSNLKVLQQQLSLSIKKYVLFASVNVPYIPETECLLNAHFPEKIYSKQSGPNYFSLQKRGTSSFRSTVFSSENLFEQPVEQWNENPACLDTSVFYSGIYSYLLDAANIYSSTFSTEISRFPGLKNKHFRISVMVLTTHESDAYIVFDVTRNDKNIFWNGKKINDMVQPGKWQKVCMVQHPLVPLKKDDRLKIYIWNNSNGRLWIDDFKVDIVENE